MRGRGIVGFELGGAGGRLGLLLGLLIGGLLGLEGAAANVERDFVKAVSNLY